MGNIGKLAVQVLIVAAGVGLWELIIRPRLV